MALVFATRSTPGCCILMACVDAGMHFSNSSGSLMQAGAQPPMGHRPFSGKMSYVSTECRAHQVLTCFASGSVPPGSMKPWAKATSWPAVMVRFSRLNTASPGYLAATCSGCAGMIRHVQALLEAKYRRSPSQLSAPSGFRSFGLVLLP